MTLLEGCPNCSHTLAKLCTNEGLSHWHCPRCGTVAVTIQQAAGLITEVCTPRLVERCRAFAANFTSADDFMARTWNRLGIAESIDRPENRPDTK